MTLKRDNLVFPPKISKPFGNFFNFKWVARKKAWEPMDYKIS